ncbi:MAG TPA: hypothetical protein VE262_18665 [Blastocatellia bacterium]|nr:hypothetical protein [Blastocatellia bacterium]
MRTKGKRHLALILALGAILAAPTASDAQLKGKAKRGQAAAAAAGGVEPLRVLGGQMRGRVISGRAPMNGRPSSFTFGVTKAEVRDGRLHLSGNFSLGRARRAPEVVSAKIAGTMAKAANPWPGASDDAPKKDEPPAGEQQQGREAKSAEAAGQLGQLAQSTQDTARKTPAPPGERTEQTQSLYAQAEAETGCGILFLSLELSPRLRAAIGAGPRPVQVGVLLAPTDNRLGEEINRRLCAIVRLSGDKPGDARLNAAVEELNRLLASER